MLTLHELMIDGEDAWVTANKNIPRNLSNYGGAYNGALIDSAVQEYDLRTGKLLRTWDALDHIPPGDSYATVPTNGFPWDAYHVNSVELGGDGTFLVSMRNTWAAYLVDIATGKIEWTLGGRHSSFRFGPGADFQWQHDVSLAARRRSSRCSTTTAASSPAAAPTCRRPGPRAGWCSSSTSARDTATLVAQYGAGGEFDSEYMGDTAAAARRQRVRRLGLGALLLRVHPLRHSCCWSGTSPAPT